MTYAHWRRRRRRRLSTVALLAALFQAAHGFSLRCPPTTVIESATPAAQVLRLVILGQPADPHTQRPLWFRILGEPLGQAALPLNVTLTATVLPDGKRGFRIPLAALEAGVAYRITAAPLCESPCPPLCAASAPLVMRTPSALPPSAPSIVALSAPNPFKVPACSKAGAERQAAGCGLLSVLVKPPAKTNGAPLRSYRVVCQQSARCVRGASRRMLADGCQFIETKGVGTPANGGLLRFQLPFPFEDEWTGFKCRVTCRNRAGWSAGSRRMSVRIPPSPPPLAPKVLGISAYVSGHVIVRIQKPNGTLGVNAYMAVGTLGTRRAAVTTAGQFKSELAAAAGSEVRIIIAPGTYTPSRVYTIEALYTHKDVGVGQLLGPPSSGTEFKMPGLAGGKEEDGPPGAPSIASLYTPSPFTTPACTSYGEAYTAAGCGMLTVQVDKPLSDGNADIVEYLVVCKPTWCPGSVGAGRRRLRSARNPCSYPGIASGLGEPVQGGRLGRVQFQLSMESWQSTTYGCNVTCRNKFGWSDPSDLSTTGVPPKPPTNPPYLGVTLVDGTKLQLCLTHLSETNGATSWQVVGTPSDGGAEVVASGSLGSSSGPVLSGSLGRLLLSGTCPEVEIGSRPGVTFSFLVWYKKTVQPGGLVMLSSARTFTFTVPEGPLPPPSPPPPPVISTVAFLAHDGSTYISALITLQKPASSEALTYAIRIEGNPEGPRALEGPTGPSVSDRLDGAKLLAFVAVFTPGVEYTFTVLASSSAGQTASAAKLATPCAIS